MHAKNGVGWEEKRWESQWESRKEEACQVGVTNFSFHTYENYDEISRFFFFFGKSFGWAGQRPENFFRLPAKNSAWEKSVGPDTRGRQIVSHQGWTIFFKKRARRGALFLLWRRTCKLNFLFLEDRSGKVRSTWKKACEKRGWMSEKDLQSQQQKLKNMLSLAIMCTSGQDIPHSAPQQHKREKIPLKSMILSSKQICYPALLRVFMRMYWSESPWSIPTTKVEEGSSLPSSIRLYSLRAGPVQK